MEITPTDVMIHTGIELSDTQFSEIANKIHAIDGVISFEKSSRVPRLIMVTYNATRVRALTILDKITRMGFNASLVGI